MLPTRATATLVGSVLIACQTAPPSTVLEPSPSATVAAPATTATATLRPRGLPKFAKVGDLPAGDFAAIRFAPSEPDVVYVATFTNAVGTFRSDDGGVTWRRWFRDTSHNESAFARGSKPTTTYQRGPSHARDIAVHPKDAGVVFAADSEINAPISKMVGSAGTVAFTVLYPADPSRPDPERRLGAAIAISPSDPNVMYFGDEGGRILKSGDGGATWRTVAPPGSRNDDAVTSVVVDPRTSARALAVTRSGLALTTDGGESWAHVLSERAGSLKNVAVAARAPDRILVASATGILRSIDGGASWSSVSNLVAHAVEFAPSDPAIAYASTPQGVLRSVDGGATWNPRSAGLAHLDIGPLAVHPLKPDVVVVGGNVNIWTSWFAPERGPSARPSVPASTRSEGLYRTADGGATWSRVGTEALVNDDVLEVAVDPTDPDVVYAGDLCARGLYRSLDGGATWSLSHSGDRANLAHYTMRIAVSRDAVFLTAQQGLGVSRDRGYTWARTGTLKDRHFHGIAVSPADSRIVLAGTAAADPRGATEFLGSWLLRSTDGGATWSPTQFPRGPTLTVDDIVFDPRDPTFVYASTTGRHRWTSGGRDSLGLGVLRSADSGITWTQFPQASLPRGIEAQSLAVGKAAGLLYLGTDQGVFRSTNGGDAWSNTGLRGEVHRVIVDPSHPDAAFAATESGLFWSAAGASWTRVDELGAGEVTGLAVAADGSRIYAAVNGVGVFKAVLSSP